MKKDARSSLIDRLSAGLKDHSSGAQELRRQVINKALSLLADIDRVLILAAEAKSASRLLYTSDSRRVIDGLLDLVSLEGIYTNLLPGVGVPIERRVKSILQGGTVAGVSDLATEQESCGTLLQSVVACLHGILVGSQDGISGVLRERILVDLIAAEAQLGFAPNIRAPQKNFSMFNELIDRSDSSFGVWFRSGDSYILSNQPSVTDMSQHTGQIPLPASDPPATPDHSRMAKITSLDPPIPPPIT